MLVPAEPRVGGLSPERLEVIQARRDPCARGTTSVRDRGATPAAPLILVEWGGGVLVPAPAGLARMDVCTAQLSSPPPLPPAARARAAQDMTSWVDAEMHRFTKPTTASWQPSDLLPDPSAPEFFDAVAALRAEAALLPAELLVALVGDMVTEEALPSYMSMLNRLHGTQDETGAQDHAWAR